jgi:hypothetical protein
VSALRKGELPPSTISICREMALLIASGKEKTEVNEPVGRLADRK